MNVVKYGMEGYAVKLLQYALSRSGLDVGNLDGIFGRRTARALQQFQREMGLSADGVAGKLTWAALYPYIAGYTLHKIVPQSEIYRAKIAWASLPSLPLLWEFKLWSHLDLSLSPSSQLHQL